MLSGFAPPPRAAYQNRRRGFNLIEAAVVLAVVGAVLGTIWGVSAHFYEEYKVNKTVEGILTTARNVQNLISIRDAEAIGHDVVLNNLLISARLLPETWLSQMKTPFGGSFELKNITALQIGFKIYIYSIQKSPCIKMLSRISSIASREAGAKYNLGLGLGSIELSGGWNTQTFPVTLEQAKNACVNNSQNVVFVFGYTRIN